MNLIKKTETDEIIPLKFHLSQNYPNPFKQKTKIKYCVAYKTRVKITVFDSEGKMVSRLVDEVKEAGTYELKLLSADCCKASDKENDQLVDKIYSYCLEAGNYISNKQMILEK